MSNAASFFVEGALFCEAWDESMNTLGNEPNKMAEAIGGSECTWKNTS